MCKATDYFIYKEVVENAKDIILIFDLDGGIIEANKLAVDTYGYTYEELTRMNILDLRGRNNAGLTTMQFNKAKTDGIEFETIHYKKDGTGFPVEVKSVGIENPSGRYVASIIRDITLRNKRLEEIKVLASIVESSDSAIIGTTLDGTITNWNKGAEKLYGYSKAEALGKKASILIPKESGDDLERILHTIKNRSSIEQHKTIRKRKDGSFVHVSLSISPIYGNEDNIIGLSAIANDITEKNILAEKLNEHEERWRLANELIKANAFQSSLMFNVKQFDFACMYGKYIPSSIVGGDLYDCISIGNSLWFIIADVAGHGLVAAMVSAMVKGIFNNCIQSNSYPEEVLESMNAILCNILDEVDNQLVSAFVGLIRENRLFYSNAGHPYPVVLNSETGAVRVLEQNGFLLALQSNAKYRREQIEISENDMLLLYTDGLFTLENRDLIYWDAMYEHSLKTLASVKKSHQAFIDDLLQSFKPGHKEHFEDDVSIMLISEFS